MSSQQVMLQWYLKTNRKHALKLNVLEDVDNYIRIMPYKQDLISLYVNKTSFLPR